MKVEEYNPPNYTKFMSTVGALAGTGLVTMALAKGKFRNIPKLEIGIKDAILLSGGSVLGGFVGGTLTDEKEQRRFKLREASNQIIGNCLVPYACLALVNKATKNIHKYVRTACAITTLIATTILGHKIADKLNDKVFEEKRKYKVSLKDYSTDFDDFLFSASLVMNNKLLYKLTACICPFTFITSGILTGTRHNKELDLKV